MTQAAPLAPTPLASIPRAADDILAGLRVPVIAAPMLIVSGPELVIAACRAGVIGSFPTANPRGDGELEVWLAGIEAALREPADGRQPVAPYIPNLIVHKSNIRLEQDLATLLAHRPVAVITSVGSPEHVVPRLHAEGIQVWSDVASMRHARRAIEAGVDGLILLTAGAGGQTGHANPLAFVRAVRSMFGGLIAVSGGQSDGWSLWALQALGCDLGYMGTRFIATTEANAVRAYKDMVVDSELDDIHLTNAFSGLPTNMMRKSMLAQGLDPDEFGLGTPEFVMARLSGNGGADGPAGPRRYRDIWSAGHSVSGVRDVPSVADVVDRLAAEYAQARAATAALLAGPCGR
ncbi:MAG TPA: nitronate monooxygenase [Streptosporangiaceae bacterium]|nr:nitronate monooxygenase [Streptosporangiaceae bacterium]